MSDSDELLQQAGEALRRFALTAIAMSPKLQVPYTDAPERTPWSVYVGPEARRAHDLSREIRKHLGLSVHSGRAVGYRPLTRADALRDAIESLYFAGVKTGAAFEEVANEVIAEVYKPRGASR